MTRERSDRLLLLLFIFLFRGWTPPETVRGRAGGLGRGVRAMDGAAKPYLIGIWQRRCREPAWAAVQAWISTIAM